MVINHLFPVFALVLTGALLKRFNLAGDAFYATSDRLIYFIFFPALLFWKIGGSDHTFSSHTIRFYLAVMTAVGAVYLLSLLVIILFKVKAFQAGAFSQCCYRFNTYIGMAVMLTSLGESGVTQFGILIGIAIPIINVLAVTTLIWYSGEPSNWKQRVRISCKALFSNPLILACGAGLVYARWFNAFPPFMENTLRLGATITLPMALLSIGGGLTLKKIGGHVPLAFLAAVIKLAVLPAIGWAMLTWFDVDQRLFQVGMLFFALPTSTAIYVLCAQLNSDTAYASAAIMVSTLLSFFSLSAVLWWMHA